MSFHRILIWIWIKRSILLRGIFCWIVGLITLLSTEFGNHDQRFLARGSQPPHPGIVLLLISEEEWTSIVGQRLDLIQPVKEISYLTDRFFWDEDTWELLLTQILRHRPSAIGMTFFFGENNTGAPLFLKPYPFLDKRVIWSARLNPDGRVLRPIFARPYTENVGLIHLQPDFDGTLRKVAQPRSETSILPWVLASGRNPNIDSLPPGLNPPLNFVGLAGTFPTLKVKDLVEGRIRPEAIRGKLVLIGAKDSSTHQILTPLGPMSMSEVMANAAQNYIENRWIVSTPTFWILISFIPLLFLSIWIMLSYPQTVSFVVLVFMTAAIAVLSTFLFDSFYLWYPITSPIAVLATVFVVFQGYQLSINEQKTWKMEQETKSQAELNKLKSHFISLFSHDLKTPIAKIQAIVDRMEVTREAPNQTDDIQLLRSSTQELNRYIQNILRLTRIESEKLEIRIQPADLNVVAENVVQNLRPIALAKGTTIETDFTPLFSIEFDPDLIFEVIQNLVENAIKYSPSNTKIRVSTFEENETVTLVVQDWGSGIPAADQPLIWNRFYRGSNQLATKGTGLGLYLVKFFVELHGGSVFLISDHNEGTRIGFRLPLSSGATS